MSRSVVAVALGSCLAAIGAPTCGLAGEPAWSPNDHLLNGWEPITSSLDGVVDKAYTHTVRPNDQGYLEFRCRSDGSSVGQCKRTLWDSFAWRAGITVVNTHGGIGNLCAVYSANESELINRTEGGGWADKDGDGSEDAGMLVRWQDNEGKWGAEVASSWLRDNWKSDHDSQRSIVVMACCYAAEGNVLESAGGRVGFGDKGCALHREVVSDVGHLFAGMNGTMTYGLTRRASEAWANHTFMAIANTGNLNTTLCPSVENPPTDNVYPVGPEGGASGTGYVIFDTHSQIHLATNGDPSEALKHKVVRGNVTIYNIRWNGDNRIDFDYATDCIVDYEVEMRVVAYELRAKGLGMQKLDGGSITWGEGIAPNADDFVWTFED